MAITPLFGRPGVSGVRTFGYGEVFLWADDLAFVPGGGVIDGTNSRDYANSTDLFLLRPGLLMGKRTANNKYAPSILGVNQSAYTSGGTTLTVTPAQAVEIVRRVGASGNLNFIGPPAAAGTVAVITQAFSAVNTGTGAITITSLGANLIAGAFVAPTDGSQIPKTAVPGSYGIEVPPDSSDADFPRIPFRGMFDVTKIIDYPTDTSLKQWVKDQMCKNGAGQFSFSDEY